MRRKRHRAPHKPGGTPTVWAMRQALWGLLCGPQGETRRPPTRLSGSHMFPEASRGVQSHVSRKTLLLLLVVANLEKTVLKVCSSITVMANKIAGEVLPMSLLPVSFANAVRAKR